MGLQWGDLDFETGVLNVCRQVSTVRGRLEISQPKTKNSIRKIVLPPAVVKVLREYKETVHSRWMFPSPVKEDMPLGPGVALKRLHAILERAGCKHVRFHDGCIKIGLNQKHPHSKGRTDLVLFLFYKHKGGKNEEYS